jgi:signal transduction histidine kinase
LIGWIDLLKLRFDGLPQKDEYVSLLDDMATDVEALKKVASRFGKVGSDIKLASTNVDNVIVSTLEYFNRRLPHINNEIRMHYIPRDPDTILFLDVELISWAFENLIRNCIDAMKLKSGNITIESYRHEQKFYLLFYDEGIGIIKSNYKKIFEPGVTTKSRGWGLGLSLTKRIIEEYHGGKIRVLESAVDVGTTFEIVLPIPPQGE